MRYVETGLETASWGLLTSPCTFRHFVQYLKLGDGRVIRSIGTPSGRLLLNILAS